MPPAGFTAPHLRNARARKKRVELRLRFRAVEAIHRGTATQRFAAPEPRRGERRNRPGCRNDLLHLAGISIAMQGKIAARAERLPGPLPEPAAECPHRQIVGYENAVKPDLTADHVSDHA